MISFLSEKMAFLFRSARKFLSETLRKQNVILFLLSNAKEQMITAPQNETPDPYIQVRKYRVSKTKLMMAPNDCTGESTPVTGSIFEAEGVIISCDPSKFAMVFDITDESIEFARNQGLSIRKELIFPVRCVEYLQPLDKWLETLSHASKIDRFNEGDLVYLAPNYKGAQSDNNHPIVGSPNEKHGKIVGIYQNKFNTRKQYCIKWFGNITGRPLRFDEKDLFNVNEYLEYQEKKSKKVVTRLVQPDVFANQDLEFTLSGTYFKAKDESIFIHNKHKHLFIK